MNSTDADRETISKSAIEPEADWSPQWEGTFLGVDGTPGGRLVRLAEMLKWRIKFPAVKPYSAALKEFCDAIPTDAMDWLYQVNTDYAKSIDSKNSFGFFTEEHLKANKNKNLSNARFNRIHRDSGRKTNWPENLPTIDNDTPTEPGLPALKRKISESWSNGTTKDGRLICDSSKLLINFIAIPFDKAHQHWGWGRSLVNSIEPKQPETFEQLCVYHKACPGHTWPVSFKTILKDEKERRQQIPGAKGIVESMRNDLGGDISTRRINILIQKYDQEDLKRIKSRGKSK